MAATGRGDEEDPAALSRPLLSGGHVDPLRVPGGTSNGGTAGFDPGPGGFAAPSVYDTLTRNAESGHEALSPRRRRQVRLDMDSFDFEPYSSETHIVQMQQLRQSHFEHITRVRWVLTFFVGMVTALIAVAITTATHHLTDFKFDTVNKLIREEASSGAHHGLAYFTYVGISVGFAICATLPVVAFAPVAAGSGISEIKCVLNGVKLPYATRISTLCAKAVGVCMAVAAGLPVGMEGPMIHSGAVVGAGLSQGKSTTMGFDTKYTKFKEFRNDIEKRDFITCGAAAGVAAAFGAPVGGVLFALEEGASFWFQNLTWRAFFCAMVSTYTLDVCLSALRSGVGFGNLSEPGMFTFGDFAKQNNVTKSYHIWEIPAFILIGMLGGLIGALFNHMNKRLTQWRMRRVVARRSRFLEVVLIAFVVSSLSFVVPFVEYAVRGKDACTPLPGPSYSFSDTMVRFYCPEGHYSQLATLFFAPAEDAIHQLFHFTGSFQVWYLLLFMVVFVLLNCWTYGIAVPSGLFIPSLLAGSAMGRIVGSILNHFFDAAFVVDPGTYSLIGAAAMLGGMARMTISLAVILLESTGDYQYGLPLMLTLMAARWTGNYFNEGLYDIHIALKRWPLLEPEPENIIHHLRARDLMTEEPTAVPSVVRVGDLVDMLERTSHHGYPVIHPRAAWAARPRLGTLAGIIHRKHLSTLLHFAKFLPAPPTREVPRSALRRAIQAQQPTPGRARSTSSAATADLRVPISDAHRRAVLTWEDFEGTYPRYPRVSALNLTAAQRDMYLDLRPYMNKSPPTVKLDAPAIHAFRLFRGLGMRHLTVINEDGDVVGIVTRRDVTAERIRSRFNVRLRRGISSMGLAKRYAGASDSLNSDTKSPGRRGVSMPPVASVDEDDEDEDDDVVIETKKSARARMSAADVADLHVDSDHEYGSEGYDEGEESD